MRFRRPLLGFATGLAAILALLLLVLLVRALLGGAPRTLPRPERGERADLARPSRPLLTGRARETREEATPPSWTGGYLAWLEHRPALAGATRFQRRLSLGTELRGLAGARASGRMTRAEADLRLRARMGKDGAFLLQDDLSRCPFGDLDACLAWLTEPRRDPDGLHLVTLTPPADPLGSGSRLRIWTKPGDDYPRPVAEAADLLLGRLGRVVGEADDRGYDVLATPALGADVFPARPPALPFKPAGYYSIVDDFCVVDTSFYEPFRSVLLRHELVHAWHTRLMPEWRSRFLEEGLAEYLARLEPSDAGLSVPPDRLADEAAALLALVAQLRAVGVGGIDLGELVDASPLEFYALGWFGYLLALTTVAAIGGDAVEEALSTRDESRLRLAARGLGLAGLLRWARQHAAGGDPAAAVVIQDADPRWVDRVPGTVGPPAGRVDEVLRRLGAEVPAPLSAPLLDLLMAAPWDLPRSNPEALTRVLAEMARTPRITLATEATTAMEDPLVVRSLPPEGMPLLDADVFRADTRIALVDGLHAALERSLGPGKVPILAVGDAAVPARLPLTLVEAPFRPESLIQGVRGLTAEDALVVTVASARTPRAGEPSPAGPEDGQRREALYYAALLRFRGTHPRAVLVLDLGAGQGAARALAAAFALALGPGAPVAYWDLGS